MTRGTSQRPHRRQWRFYETASGSGTVRRELDALESDDAAELLAAMRLIEKHGFKHGGARHLRGETWEARADGATVTIRALFAKQGRFGQVLLALHVFEKKTQKTPKQKIELAERRLWDWVQRGRSGRVTAKPAQS